MLPTLNLFVRVGALLGLLPTEGHMQLDEAVRIERSVVALLRHERPARPIGELHPLIERRTKHPLAPGRMRGRGRGRSHGVERPKLLRGSSC